MAVPDRVCRVPVYDSFKGQVGLERQGGRTPHAVFTRIAQRLLAPTAAVWHNWASGAPDKRSLTAYDHEQSIT
jgi:hypothetical protein